MQRADASPPLNGVLRLLDDVFGEACRKVRQRSLGRADALHLVAYYFNTRFDGRAGQERKVCMKSAEGWMVIYQGKRGEERRLCQEEPNGVVRFASPSSSPER